MTHLIVNTAENTAVSLGPVTDTVVTDLNDITIDFLDEMIPDGLYQEGYTEHSLAEILREWRELKAAQEYRY